MAEPAAAPKKGGWLKAVATGLLGLGSGVAGTYAATLVQTIAKPPLPVANFAATADGLTVTCQNQATGDSGWWDFGDGSPLEPFAADQPTVTHTYAKPGSYAVKLVVRNFTSDENDRTVSVEVAAGGKDGPAPPQVVGFAVQRVSPAAVAPATFRVTAEVQNAAYCVCDLGDGRVEVTDGGGKIDRLVTFHEPGSYSVQLVAHNGKTAVKQAAAAKVEAPPEGTLTVVLTVADGGTKLDRMSRSETVAVPAPKNKAAGFSRTIAARPGFSLVEAAPTRPNIPGVKNLKLTVAADKKTAAVSGEWADPKAVKADVLIPVKLTEERASARPARVTNVTGQLVLTASGKATTTIPLPPPPPNLDGVSRNISVEVRQAGANGKSYLIAAGPLVGRGPVTIPAKNIYSPPTAAVTTASYDIENVKVAFEVRSGVVPAGGP